MRISNRILDELERRNDQLKGIGETLGVVAMFVLLGCIYRGVMLLAERLWS